MLSAMNYCLRAPATRCQARALIAFSICKPKESRSFEIGLCADCIVRHLQKFSLILLHLSVSIAAASFWCAETLFECAWRLVKDLLCMIACPEYGSSTYDPRSPARLSESVESDFVIQIQYHFLAWSLSFLSAIQTACSTWIADPVGGCEVRRVREYHEKHLVV